MTKVGFVYLQGRILKQPRYAVVPKSHPIFPALKGWLGFGNQKKGVREENGELGSNGWVGSEPTKVCLTGT